MMEAIIPAVFNFLTPISIIVGLLVPSLWISAAVGVSVAMIGVIAFTHGQPNSQIAAAWLIGQVAAAVTANFFRRKAS